MYCTFQCVSIAVLLPVHYQLDLCNSICTLLNMIDSNSDSFRITSGHLELRTRAWSCVLISHGLTSCRIQWVCPQDLRLPMCQVGSFQCAMRPVTQAGEREIADVISHAGQSHFSEDQNGRRTLAEAAKGEDSLRHNALRKCRDLRAGTLGRVWGVMLRRTRGQIKLLSNTSPGY
jgi:hypothetical protein